MTNIKLLEKLEQCNGAFIDKLFWIAAQPEVSDLESFLEDMDYDDFKSCFPSIAKLDSYGEEMDGAELLQLLTEENKLGFVAEIHHPECNRFTYKNGKPSSWTTSRGISRMSYVYAETPELLIAEIELVSAKIFKEYIAKDKKKKLVKA